VRRTCEQTTERGLPARTPYKHNQVSQTAASRAFRANSSILVNCSQLRSIQKVNCGQFGLAKSKQPLQSPEMTPHENPAASSLRVDTYSPTNFHTAPAPCPSTSACPSSLNSAINRVTCWRLYAADAWRSNHRRTVAGKDQKRPPRAKRPFPDLRGSARAARGPWGARVLNHARHRTERGLPARIHASRASKRTGRPKRARSTFSTILVH
jgi:hypothetical protein